MVVLAGCSSALSFAQIDSTAPSKNSSSGSRTSESTLTLRPTSSIDIASEKGGAFMNPAKCDAEGSLFIRKLASDRPLLGPVVKIDSDGKRTALFDPVAFSELGLIRADGFSPASDGGMDQIANTGGLNPSYYVLHFSADGSRSSSTLLDADFEVYTFAAFPDGNFLVSGVKRNAQDKNDRGRNLTAVFSGNGRELTQLSFLRKTGVGKTLAQKGVSQEKQDQDPLPTLDLEYAEVGSDGNVYAMQYSSPAVVYVIASSGKILKKVKVASPVPDGLPGDFHISGNRLAISFEQKNERHTLAIADAQTGRKIASYDESTGAGTSFSCFSANDDLFTFLKLGEGSELGVIRAEPQ
jgi:hypothetical protein